MKTYFNGIIGAFLFAVLAICPVFGQADNLYDDQPTYTEQYQITNTEDGQTYITNNYYNDNNEEQYVFQGDDYDYYYSSRIRRFHRPYHGFGYFNNCYTDRFYYDYDPFFWGTPIYMQPAWACARPWRPGWSFNFGWGYPSYSIWDYTPGWGWSYGWDSYYANPWAYANPHLGYYGWGASYYGYAYNNPYYGYNYGYNQGYHDGYTQNNIGNYYGPRGSHSASADQGGIRPRPASYINHTDSSDDGGGKWEDQRINPDDNSVSRPATGRNSTSDNPSKPGLQNPAGASVRPENRPSLPANPGRDELNNRPEMNNTKSENMGKPSYEYERPKPMNHQIEDNQPKKDNNRSQMENTRPQIDLENPQNSDRPSYQYERPTQEQNQVDRPVQNDTHGKVRQDHKSKKMPHAKPDGRDNSNKKRGGKKQRLQSKADSFEKPSFNPTPSHKNDFQGSRNNGNKKSGPRE